VRDHDEEPVTRFAPARGARLAYQVFGAGDQTVVAIPPLAQNIELSWEQPAIRRMLERFGSFCRYLHFDKRGTGCSDRRSQVADIDERVDDVRAVMDHAGIEHAHLFGSSEGGPMTLLFAATYPDRVDSVILFGSGASTFPQTLSGDELSQIRERQRLAMDRWGTPESTIAARFAPTLAAADPSFVAWHQRYERFAASTDSLHDLIELALRVDVSEVLPSIVAPILVIHRTDDLAVPIECGRHVAATVPDARMVEQPGPDHYAYAGDVDGWMDEFERFVTGEVRSEPVARNVRASVHIVTLGRFAVLVDGEEVPTSVWGSRRSRQLCKRLVAARGWPVTRDELFDLLWPDETDRQRLGARLSVQLSTVRRVLGGGVIADRESIRLNHDEVSTDLELFHRTHLDEAIVAAYQGEFLPDDVYEDWATATRTEVRTRFVLAARRLVQAALEDGDPHRAVELSGRLVEVDPYDEQAHLLRVSALLGAGSVQEAERAHAGWREAMTELGLQVPTWDELRAGLGRKVV
jgi:pimeloyl-ACP methyl ester carboxylesterase/DNA-binding SARP family transcriptional activator